MFTETLRLIVDLDTAGAVQKVETFHQRSEKAGEKAKSSLDKVGTGMQRIGAGMVTFGAVAVAGLAKAGQAAAELEQAVGGTEAVFGEAREVVDEYAENAATKVGLSEQAFRDLTTVAGAQLKNLGFELDDAADNAIKLTEIGADLAATYGGTTAEAVEALGAAFRGEADPAERFGLALNVTAANAKAVEMGLAESESQVDSYARAQAVLALIMEQSADAQGQFAREADTAAGQQQILNAQFQDLKASIGEGVLPAMKTLLGVANDVIGGLSELNAVSDGTLGKVATFGAVGLIAAGGLSAIIGKVITMRQNIGTAISGLTNMGEKIKGVGRAAAVTAGAAGIGAFAFAMIELQNARHRQQLDELAEGFLAVGDSINETTKKAILAAEDFGSLQDIFDRVLDQSVLGAEDMLELAEAAGVAGDELDEMRDKIEAKRDADVKASVQQEAYSEQVREGADAMREQEEATEDATSALQEWADKQKALFDPIFAANDALIEQQEAQAAVTESELKLIAAEEALAEARRKHGRNSEEATAATLDLIEAQRDLDQAHRDVISAAVDADSAFVALREAVMNQEVSITDARAAIDRWVDSGVVGAETADFYRGELDKLILKAIATGAVDPTIDVSTVNTAQAREELHRVESAADRIPRNVRIHVSASGRTATELLAGYGALPGRATGGPVGPGWVGWVGEQGPELLVLNGGATGQVYTEDQVRTLGGGGGGGFMGGGGTTVVNINLAGAIISSEDDATRWVAAAVNRAGLQGLPLHIKGRPL